MSFLDFLRIILFFQLLKNNLFFSKYVYISFYDATMKLPKESTMLKIATHNKIFHADEITAIALLKVFTDHELEIERIDHQSEDFSSYDMVIDISKKFDGIKYFDHHQNKGGKSSAGLIWDYLGQAAMYPKITKLIHIVDMQDTGVQKAGDFEYPSLIKAFNTHELTSSVQEEQFYKAIAFAQTVLTSMKHNQEELKRAEEIVKNAYYFQGNPKIIELDTFTPHWSSYINGIVQPSVLAVVWHDDDEENWKVKLTPKIPGRFELNTKPLKQDSSMLFVHSSGHFAIAKDEAQMAQYLRKQIK